MDYFYVGNHVGNVGLNDIFLMGKYKKKKISMSLAFHYFLTNGELTDWENGNKVVDDFLGTEIDYTLGWKVNKDATLKLGYSQLFGSSSMEVLKGGDKSTTNNWVWAMVIIKPSHTFKKNK